MYGILGGYALFSVLTTVGLVTPIEVVTSFVLDWPGTLSRTAEKIGNETGVPLTLNPNVLSLILVWWIFVYPSEYLARVKEYEAKRVSALDAAVFGPVGSAVSLFVGSVLIQTNIGAEYATPVLLALAAGALLHFYLEGRVYFVALSTPLVLAATVTLLQFGPELDQHVRQVLDPYIPLSASMQAPGE